MPFGKGSLLLLLLAWAEVASAAQSGQVLGRSVYAYPSWETAGEATKKYATADEYRAAAGDTRYVLEKIRYRSDSLAVIAYLYRPRNAEGAKRPVIVFNRGSYVRKDIAPELLTMFHRLATAGFTVVAPMYRGSDGGEGRDEMGGTDLNDLMNVVPLLGELDSLDRRNVFLYGESRGGMMVFQAIRDSFPARGAATFGAFTDLTEITSSGPGAGMAKTIWPEFEARRNEIISRRSAIQWPEKLGLPLLLMHGGEDREVPPAQTLQLATELAKAHKEFGVVVFPGENHTIRQHRLDRDRQAIEFFRRYMVN